MQVRSGMQRQAGLFWHTPAARPVPVCRFRTRDQASENKIVAEEVKAVLQLLKSENDRRVSLDDFAEPLQRLKAIGKELELDRSIQERLHGCFYERLTTNQRGFQDTVVTLQRAAFGQFKPVDLKIDLHPAGVPWKEVALPQLYRGRFEGVDNGYVLFNLFKIVDERVHPEPPLFGLITAIAHYSVPPPATADEPPRRMGVHFKKMRLQPAAPTAANPEALKKWNELLRPHNPNMDEKGFLQAELPGSIPAFVDWFLCGEQYQCHQGNMGSNVILERITPTPGTKQYELMQRWMHGTGPTSLD